MSGVWELINGISLGFEVDIENKVFVLDLLIFRFVVLWGEDE